MPPLKRRQEATKRLKRSTLFLTIWDSDGPASLTLQRLAMKSSGIHLGLLQKPWLGSHFKTRSRWLASATQLRKHWVRNPTGKGHSLVELPYPHQAGFFFSLAGRMYPTMNTEQENRQGAAFRGAELAIRKYAEDSKIALIGEIDGQILEIPAIEIPYLETRGEHSSVSRIYPINLRRGNWPQPVRVWTDIRVFRSKLLEFWPANPVPVRSTPPATQQETATRAKRIIREELDKGARRAKIESELQCQLGVSRERARHLYRSSRPSDAPSRGRPPKNARIS